MIYTKSFEKDSPRAGGSMGDRTASAINLISGERGIAGHRSVVVERRRRTTDGKLYFVDELSPITS